MENNDLIFNYNLQYFAKEGNGGEKTEDATPKKIKDTRKEGQVAKSKELTLAVSLLTFFYSLKIFIGYVGKKLVSVFNFTYSDFKTSVDYDFTPQYAHSLVVKALEYILLTMFPFLIVSFVVAFLINKIQIKWMVTFKPLTPKFSKMNPLKGFKRIFSKDSLMELLMSIAKIIAISAVVYSTIKNETYIIYEFYDMTIQQTLGWMFDIIMNLGIKISVILLIIGLVDFVYQKRKHKEDIKMTKQEIKDEYKNSEGDPKIKNQIRSKMLAASQRRMMNDIPKADVVITNPTHFAVAIYYERDGNGAPIVLAKGADYLAKKIKEAAKENDIEIVENKAVARMLYYNVDIGKEIPQELYQAVAEILAYVYKLKNKV